MLMQEGLGFRGAGFYRQKGFLPILNENDTLVKNFHYGFSYWIYGAMGILAALFVWKFVPETKGKTLEEMEHVWKKEKKEVAKVEVD